MSSNFWEDDAAPVAPQAKGGFWDDDDASAGDSFWEDDAPKMTMQRGTETREIDATPAAMHEAEAEGFNTPEAQAHLSQYKPRTPSSPLMSGIRSGVSSATMGFDDEATGLVGGALGGLQGKGFVRSYKNSRDQARAINETAQMDNPGSSMIGSLVGGMAVPGFSALKAGRIGGAIANGALTAGVMGGVQGLGDSKDITNLPEVGKDVLIGAGKGAALGGIVGAGAHAVTNPGQIKALPGYAKAMIKGGGQGAAVSYPLPDLQAVAIPLGAMRGMLKHYKANGVKMAEEAAERSTQNPKITIGDPPAGRNIVQDGPQKFSQKAFEATKKYALNKAVRVGTDQAYNTATGTEEGLPDPMRDQATGYLKEKFDLSDGQAEVAKRMMPSMYDALGKGGKAVAKWHPNGVRKGHGIDKPRGDFVMEREISHNGENLRHEIYKNGTEVLHYLVRPDGERVSIVKGHMTNAGDSPAFVVGWSTSTTKGEGHGKKLYDLALDTHDRLMSDTSLSPKGSHQVYEKHFGESPELDVKIAEIHTDDRHDVRLRDKEGYRKSRGISPFDPDLEGQLKDVNTPSRPRGRGPRDTVVPVQSPISAPRRSAVNQSAIDDLEARLRSGKTPELALRGVMHDHPDASAYQISSAYRQIKDRVTPEQAERNWANSPAGRQRAPTTEQARIAVQNHVNSIIDRGGSRDDAVQYLSQQGFNGHSARNDINRMFDAHERLNPSARGQSLRQGTDAELKAILRGDDFPDSDIPFKSEDLRAQKREQYDKLNQRAHDKEIQRDMDDEKERYFEGKKDSEDDDYTPKTDEDGNHIRDDYGNKKYIDNYGDVVDRYGDQLGPTRKILRGDDFPDSDIPFKSEDLRAQKREQYDRMNNANLPSKEEAKAWGLDTSPSRALDWSHNGTSPSDHDLYETYRLVEQISHNDPKLVVNAKDALINAGSNDPKVRQHIADWARGRVKEGFNAREWQTVLNGIGDQRKVSPEAPARTGPLTREERWKVTAASEKFAEKGGSIEDARDYLRDTHGIHPDRLGRELDASFENSQQAVKDYDNRRVDRPRPDQKRTAEALRRMKEDQFEGPDARGFMQLKDDFREEQHKGGYRLDWEQISDKATRVNRSRDAERDKHERSYRRAREEDGDEYQAFRDSEATRRDQQRAQRDREQQEKTLRSKLTEDMSEEEMRAIANRVAPRPRGEIDERVIENFRAERQRSKMHPVGTEPRRPITLEDQVRRVERERAEAAQKRKEEQWNSLMSQVERAQEKPSARPKRRLRIAPTAAELKALLRKKDKK